MATLQDVSDAIAAVGVAEQAAQAAAASYATIDGQVNAAIEDEAIVFSQQQATFNQVMQAARDATGWGNAYQSMVDANTSLEAAQVAARQVMSDYLAGV